MSTQSVSCISTSVVFATMWSRPICTDPLSLSAHTSRTGNVKTTMCRYWQRGCCTKDKKDCAHAHGPGDLDEKSLWKTRMCALASGRPCWKDDCPFAHNPRELRIIDTADHASDHDADQASESECENSPKPFKTKMCTFNRAGCCNKGQKCTFAHSARDLVSNSNDAMVPIKTKMCTFNLGGRCNKGDECTYAHYAWELTSNSNDTTYPANAMTKMCKWGSKCTKSVCHFAHREGELVKVEAVWCKFGQACKVLECTFVHRDADLIARESIAKETIARDDLARDDIASESSA